MKLYYCNITQIKDLHGAEYISSKRRERMQRYLRQDDRIRCLAAGLLLRAAFGEEKYKQISTDFYGKPYLPGDVFFNLSHSGDYVVLAVAPCEVGVDIERVTPYSKSIANKCFTAAELEWLSEQACNQAFFKLWTGKESVMKATGLGFRMPPESFQILPMSCGIHSIAGKHWFLQWCSLPEHVICLATATEQSIQLLPLNWTALSEE